MESEAKKISGENNLLTQAKESLKKLLISFLLLIQTSIYSYK